MLYKLALFFQCVSQLVNPSVSKLHQNYILTAELNQVELAFWGSVFYNLFFDSKGTLYPEIFVFPSPTKAVPQCLLKHLTPLSSDNNLVRQAVSLLRLLSS